MRITRSLRKRIRNAPFRITADENFDKVIECCASTPRNDEWNLDNPAHAVGYLELFEQGVHIEVWQDDKLVGGLYIALGRMFFGESMFSHCRMRLKAFYHLQQHLLAEHYSLIDCQMMNPT